MGDVKGPNFLDFVGFNWVEMPKVDTRCVWYFDLFDVVALEWVEWCIGNIRFVDYFDILERA